MTRMLMMCCAATLIAGCTNGTGGTGIVPASYTTGEDGGLVSAYDAVKATDYVTAERELARLLERDPSDPYANLAMGYVMQQTGRKAQARPLYDVALREGVDVYPDRHFVLSDREYDARPVEEDSIAELAARNIASLAVY